jgi:hypothetical protein
MSDWFHNLPIVWMALLVFGFTYLLSAGIYIVVMTLAVGDRARSFKSVSPGMLPPLGIIFGLFVGFTAAQVWSDNDRAVAAVDREASELRSAVILAAAFPGEPETRLRALISSCIADATGQEWPLMSHRAITWKVPHAMADAVQLTLGLQPTSPGQQIAQRGIATALENSLDARRQRLLISQAQVSVVKWSCVFLLAVCALIAIAMVHSDNRLASAISLFLFATGVAAAVLLIADYDRPFIGDRSVRADPLLQVMPAADRNNRIYVDPKQGDSPSTTTC